MRQKNARMSANLLAGKWYLSRAHVMVRCCRPRHYLGEPEEETTIVILPQNYICAGPGSLD